MAVRPEVRLFFPCASVAVNDDDNRVTIVDPIFSLYLLPDTVFPCSSGVLYFYLEILGGVGTYHCRIRGRDENQILLVETTPLTIVFTEANRYDGGQFPFKLPEFEISEPGIIEFGLYANYSQDPIATTHIRFRRA
jgi:hypothetical protein